LTQNSQNKKNGNGNSFAWTLFQAIVARMNEVQDIQGKLIAEVDAEGAKYGDDVKYLADFTGGIKRMFKPKNLQEALDQLEDATVIFRHQKNFDRWQNGFLDNLNQIS